MHCNFGNALQFFDVSGLIVKEELWRWLMGCSVEHGRVPYRPVWTTDWETNCKFKSAKPSEEKFTTCAWISRPAWRLFVSKGSPVMAIPISALVHWYANFTHPACLWLKSEILGLRRRELGRPVGRRGVPADNVRPGEGRCELSTLHKIAMPLNETSFTRMRWPRFISISYFAMVILGHALRSWWATPYLLSIFLQLISTLSVM